MLALPNIITIGDPESPLFVFRNAEEGTNRDCIGAVGGVFSVDVIGDELSIDTVTAVVQVGRPPLPVSVERDVYVSPDNGIYISPEDTIYYTEHINSGSGGQDGDVSAIPYGTPFRWECDGRLIASFYCLQPKRIGRWMWEINAVSGVGLLDKLYHVGGIYTGQPFAEVVEEIVGGVFPYTVAPALAEQQVYGWLPYATRRENLHQLLMALGASMRRDTAGEVTFVFLTADSPAEVPDSRIAVNGSVDYDAPATRAEVTEHAFFISAATESVTLFDNSMDGGAAENTEIKFGEPMYDLAASDGLTIEKSGVNYAVVSGRGSLEGKPYAHFTRIVAADAESPLGVENVKHLDADFTLVSLSNSSNIAKRILAYYSGARLVKARIKLLGERCGDILSMSDPFYKPITGFLQSVDVNASTNLLGYATLVENYVPAYQGNNISMSETLTGSGTWISPFDGEIVVVVISGGQGGGAGNPGEAAATPTISNYNSSSSLYGTWIQARFVMPRHAKAGKGGVHGTPGAGGRVYITTLSVTEGQEIAYACGIGGAGEVYGTQTGGAPGTDTVFGTISSASGTSYPNGYVDPISGTVYATPGENGINGNDGTGWVVGENGSVSLVMPDPIAVEGTLYANGSTGKGTGEKDAYIGYSLSGGRGGGAAYGSNGAIGGTGYGSIDYRRHTASAVPAAGGRGADAIAPPKASGYGRGGTSGNGGGGAGAVGVDLKGSDPDEYMSSTAWLENKGSDHDVRYTLTMTAPAPAQGGNGSDGGRGADGVIILFRGG